MLQASQCPTFDPDAGFWDAARFVSRGDCGAWDGVMKMVYMSSQFGIFAAYMAISATLLFAHFFEKKLEDDGHEAESLTSKETFRARAVYVAFIAACGVGHLDGVFSFSWPSYHVFAAWHLTTAVASWFAVLVTLQLRVRIISAF